MMTHNVLIDATVSILIRTYFLLCFDYFVALAIECTLIACWHVQYFSVNKAKRKPAEKVQDKCWSKSADLNHLDQPRSVAI